MRTAISTVAACLMVVGSSSCTRPSARSSIDEVATYPAPAGKVVRLDLASLDVDVRVEPRDDIRASLRFEARASSKRAARRWIEHSKPTFDDSDEALEIRQRRRTSGFVIGFLDARGRLELEIPPRCRLEISTASGDVTIDGSPPLAGTVRIKTASGDVRVAGGVDELIVRTASGDLRSEGEPLALLEVDTASGDVRLESGAARVLADTASGDLRLHHLSGDLSADTTSGDISAAWDEAADDASVRISTTSGDVTLRLAGDADPGGELRTTSGEIRSSFDGAWDRRHKRLTLSGTGPSVTVRTRSGEITLRRGA